MGKALLKRRAELAERGLQNVAPSMCLQHVLDCGGARRTTLRGRENIRKRDLIQAACANLLLLMRHLSGIGTPKQALATPWAGFTRRFARCMHPVWAISPLCRCFYLFVARQTGQNPRTSRDIAASR